MAELLALPGMIMGIGAGGAGPIIEAAANAPATGAAMGSTAATAASAAPSIPKAADLFGGIDTGVRLGELAGMNQQPQQQQGPVVQAPPSNIPRPMQAPSNFTPSALGILQEFLRNKGMV